MRSSLVEEMRSRVLRFCTDRALPVPPIGWGLENRSTSSPADADQVPEVEQRQLH